MRPPYVDLPETVLGMPVKAVVDTWIVSDQHGSRTYCKLRTSDRRDVVLLRLEDRWHPTIVLEPC